MLRNALEWMLCKIGLHRWVDTDDGKERTFPSSTYRAACIREGCEAINLGPYDRMEIARRKFELIAGGRAPTEPDLPAVIDLRVLPEPCEREKAIDAITGYLERM